MIGVVIVTFNSARCIQKCLDSLIREIDQAQICVVDNSSEDESCERVAAYRGVTLMKNETNVGFSAGANKGVKYWMEQGASMILLLNPDTQLETEAMQKMLKTFEKNPRAMIVQPLLTLMSQPQKINTWGNAHKGFGLVSLGGYRQQIPPGMKDQQIQYASGACMLIRSEAFRKFGLLDEQFFLYFEDTEFSQRIRQGGGEIWLSAQARVQHDHAFPLSPKKALHFLRSWRRFSSMMEAVLS